MHRIAIIGSGGMAQSRAKTFLAIDGVEVAAVFARDADKGRAICNNVHGDYHALLREDIDAVVICLPNALHATFAMQALQADKHVLIEYPLCTHAEQIDELHAAAMESGRVLMVGNTIIHEPMFDYIQKHKDRLGTILSAASRVSFYDRAIDSLWYMNRDMVGSVFAGYHYHHIELFRHLLGEAADVCSHEQSDGKRIMGGALTMRHESGASSTIHWYLIAEGTGATPRCLWLNGTRDALTIVQIGDRSQAVWGGGTDGDVESFSNEDWGNARSSQDFIDALDGKLDHAARLTSDIETLRTGLRA